MSRLQKSIQSYFYKFLLCLTCISFCNGLYFHIKETETKCFIEEVPEDTMVVGKYRIEEYQHERQEWFLSYFGLHVMVKDPTGSDVLSRTYSAEGRFTFTSHAAGEHLICLNSNSTAWFGGGQLRVHLDIQIGEHAVDYAEVAAREKLSDLQLRVRQLLDQVTQIAKEQNYQRVREEKFREVSENTNQRVLWWSVIQVGILLLVGVWQMRHLKSFFQAKKLV